jgi:hypothetical protein
MTALTGKNDVGNGGGKSKFRSLVASRRRKCAIGGGRSWGGSILLVSCNGEMVRRAHTGGFRLRQWR